MDDYGTGSSSASTVIQVPFNEIKIDMSFVTGITENKKQQAMVKQMIDFGNDAGLNTCGGNRQRGSAGLHKKAKSYLDAGIFIFETSGSR